MVKFWHTKKVQKDKHDTAIPIAFSISLLYDRTCVNLHACCKTSHKGLSMQSSPSYNSVS